jgi:hypothetical protein
MSIENLEWTDWKFFPNPSIFKKSLPSILRTLVKNPDNPGLYQLKNIKTQEFVLFGIGLNIAKRMGSLLPAKNGGVGTRNNHNKREYIWNNIENIQFRTISTSTREEAKIIEDYIKKLNIHLFNT